MRVIALAPLVCVVTCFVVHDLTRGEEPIPDTQVDAPALSDAGATAAAVKAPAGFNVSLFAAEPLVRQPIGMATDARGRLWVAENYTYAESAVFHVDSLHDRIVVLEDADRDGKADKQIVFYDQASELTSVEIGFGGVWAMCPPRLLFIPDADGDDRPDGPPVVMLEGFDVGPANHHNFANGLKWGPDGWLYGRNGITHVGHVGTPTTAPKDRVVVGPGMWRFHPVTHRFEMVASGTTNPWGHDWDENGELFFINTVIGHLWHAVPGAHFRRMFGADPNPYVYELIEQTADHFHWDTREKWQEIRQGMSQTTERAGGGHAHSGLLIYQGDNWPEAYRGDVFAINLHGRRLNRDVLERQGAGYVAHHGEDCFFWSDPWFRGIDLLTGPDGSVFVADWTDVGECHENDGVHRNSGRIFRLAHGDPAGVDVGNLAVRSDLELVELLKHRNAWFARQAQRILQERAATGRDMNGAREALTELYANAGETPIRLRALWALSVVGELDEERLVAQLADADEHVRAWAVRLLFAEGMPTSAAQQAVVELAARDRSGLVLLYLASSLQRMPAAERWALAEALATRSEFAADPMLPLLIWYGVEAAVVERPDEAVKLAAASVIPLVGRFVARRLTQDIAVWPAPVEALVAAIVELPVARQENLVEGMVEALRGIRQAKAPASWKRLQEALAQSSDEELRNRVREISVVFGDGVAMAELVALVQRGDADVNARRAAIGSLALARDPAAIPILLALVSDLDLGADAVRGLGAFDDPKVGQAIVANFGRLVPPARVAAIETLAARPGFAQLLVAAVAEGRIKREEVPVFQIRQMQEFADEALQAKLALVWPELRPLAGDAKEQIAAWHEKFAESALSKADRAAGRVVWAKTCAKCHTLFGEGAKVGPDLTGAQRGNLAYLLENIVAPSATLAPDFRMSTVALTDGRVISGVVVGKTDATWEVQTPTERVTIAVADIDTSELTSKSLMPEGLLDVLSGDEARDLFGYLMSAEQVALPPEAQAGSPPPASP